jgi:hypothetical protein
VLWKVNESGRWVTHRTVRQDTWNSEASRLLLSPGLSRILFHVSSS